MRILIVIPTWDGWIRKELTEPLMEMMSDKRFEKTICFIKGRPLEEALNMAAHMTKGGYEKVKGRTKIVYSDIEDFDKGYDFLLINDADNIPQSNFLDLAELDRDVVYGVYPIYQHYTQGQNPCRWGVLCEKPVKGLQQLKKGDSGASGAMMINRKVLEELPQPIFERAYDEEDGHVTRGVDYHFSDKAKEAGFNLYVHWDYRSLHFNEVELTGMIVAHKNYYDNLYRR